MSRPSATQSPAATIACCLRTSAARTAGSEATCDAASEASAVRIASVTSRPSSRTRSPRSISIFSAVSPAGPPFSETASPTQRYIAPVSRYVKPSRSATARATVDFPAPAGPSMAMTMSDHSTKSSNERTTMSAWSGSPWRATPSAVMPPALRRLDPRRRVLDDQAVLGRDAERVRGHEEQVGRGLTARRLPDTSTANENPARRSRAARCGRSLRPPSGCRRAGRRSAARPGRCAARRARSGP